MRRRHDGVHYCAVRDTERVRIRPLAKAKRGKEALPPLTPIKGLGAKNPNDYLSVKQRAELKDRLTKMARARRRAEAESTNLRLS